MRFLRRAYRTTIKPKSFPTFGLTTNSWDDYGTKCLFHLNYYPKPDSVIAIGSIKILQKDKDTTVIPDDFEALDETFISLGQDIGFYQNLLEHCGRPMAEDVLTALQDIAWKPPLAVPFEPTSPFRNALLRDNSAHKARRFGQSIILGQEVDERFSFKYRVEIPGATDPFDVEIDLDDRDGVPGRIVGVIGRNAVGKTRFLAALAGDLVQLAQTSEETIRKRDDRFFGKRPIFTRVVTVSYSAFDKFARPRSQHASYVYCGIRNEKGGLSRGHLLETYRANLARIRDANRATDWVSYMQRILGDSSQILSDQLSAEAENDDVANESLSLLSSGQSILANFVTALLAWIQPNSLLLFDEPETHLHPNAVASLFGVLNDILNDYKSFAIVATHSPLVIQEVPGKRVLLFRREGNTTTAEPLAVECFGESISELTRHVFETVEIPHHYKRVLNQLSQDYSFSEVMRLFDDRLSISAQSFLLTRYESQE